MKCLVFILLVCVGSVDAQRNTGPRFMAMGAGGVALRDPWSLQLNPAGMAGVSRPLFSLAYQTHFLDKDLHTKTAIVILPFQRNIIGLGFEMYGFDGYKEQSALLGYAKKFGSALSLGLGLRMHQLSIPMYGSASAFSVEAGFLYSFSPKFNIASSIANPGRTSFAQPSGAGLPVRVSFGMSYQLSSQLVVISDVVKVLDYPADVKLGAEYRLVAPFALRGGVSVNPFRQYAGFGINYKKMSLDASVAVHEALGYSPQLAFAYEF